MSAVPKPYDRQVRFGSASSNNPADPVQGYELDAEFDAVETALDQTQARLAEIQRDDGKIANGSITIDTLSPEAIDELNKAAIAAVQPQVDEATSQAERATVQADRAEDEADRAEMEADRSEEEADQSALEASNAATSASNAENSAVRAENAIGNMIPSVDTFIGDGVTDTFVLSKPVASKEYMDLYINGLYQQQSAFEVLGTILTINEPPGPVADGIVIEAKIAPGMAIQPIYDEDWGDLFGSQSDIVDWGNLN